MFVRICWSFLLQLIYQLLAADPLLKSPIWRNEDSFVAFSVLKPFCFSEYLMNRVRTLDLETYRSRHARLALPDSATLLYEASLPISPTVAWLLLSTTSSCSSGNFIITRGSRNESAANSFVDTGSTDSIVAESLDKFIGRFRFWRG